ncbi:helix-turn-helix transcriptional regulator [Amycolatopsis sp. NPDC051071]|uniref:helix-turn-helix domain-containing protein n=1 Tax=Amycolatopsis sp. NPDC051071 TaxID=3154637 RepID=UPI0034330080
MGIQRTAFAARREALGFTQETFARPLKVELSTVGRWERGTLTPHPWRRPRIAELLQVTLVELDVLLNPAEAKPVARPPSATRREVMVDAALATGGIAVGHVLDTRSEEPLRYQMDHGFAAAELARVAAEKAEDTFGLAAAAYQRACALLRTSSEKDSAQTKDAEEVAVSAATALRGQDPQSVTWRGALTLIASVIAARRADDAEASERLDHADELAQWLGVDGNIGWTAFGPSNVLIHRTSVAVTLNDPRGTLATAEQLDISALSAGLNGRQAQFHLDSAWAHTQLAEDSQAVIHLLETERVAPELVRSNPNARSLIADLLARERRQQGPALRGLALRAGVAV